ncbi:MAG: ferrous iron transport protein A [Candidatus Omnitrophica bacterium]|nr:ferrous iron transport protein A [Candidatus Omnitrophota bacterium]MDD5081161.1 ferrous iron transport protein A [Candidatus Omnitrophota bacterium]MDD5440930.1 ferrous iron transport protein A [Candidatus Omnitrophota bacterium]
MEKRLNELSINQKGKVTDIYGQQELIKKFLDMGIIRGTEIEVVKVAPLGDPIDIKIRGYHLSLRRNEAVNISVMVLNKEERI